jgi:transposase-like protein
MLIVWARASGDLGRFGCEKHTIGRQLNLTLHSTPHAPGSIAHSAHDCSSMDALAAAAAAVEPLPAYVPPPRQRLSDEDRWAIVALHKHENCTQCEIARKLGCCRQTVKSVLERYALTRRAEIEGVSERSETFHDTAISSSNLSSRGCKAKRLVAWNASAAVAAPQRRHGEEWAAGPSQKFAQVDVRSKKAMPCKQEKRCKRQNW